MSLQTLAMIVFFLVYGISHFFPFEGAGVVLAISAILIGVTLLVAAV